MKNAVLKDVFTHMGWSEEDQISAVQALANSAAFGNGAALARLTKKQAFGLLDNIDFPDMEKAALTLRALAEEYERADPILARLKEDTRKHSAHLVPSVAAEVKDTLNTIQMIPIDKIRMDPDRFQFRGQTEGGITEQGKYEGEAWDPLLHGAPLLAWQDKDGHNFVVDGHHRTEFAWRLKSEGKLHPEALPARIMREVDGYSAEDAKVIGAYVNLAKEFRDGVEKSDAQMVDAARVFRAVKGGKVHKNLLPAIPIENELADAQKAASLSDSAFAKVEAGAVPVDIAARVAEKNLAPEKQTEVMGIIEAKLQKAECDWQSKVQSGTAQTCSIV